MIGRDTLVRDYLETVQAVRANLVKPRCKPITPEFKRKRDSYEQRQQLKALIGSEPY